MAYAFSGEGALDYFPCNYGASRLLFRGPRRSLDRPYIAFLGGTETYGKYVPDPFPDLVEGEIGFGAVNLGCVNAGPDVYLNEPGVIEIASGAEAVVLQVVGATNLSNRYYTVHPRRNDRFIAATPMLKSLYRDVDFTDFHFTRHMLGSLETVSKERFELLISELRRAWVQRMQDLLARLPKRTVLLWMADDVPPPAGQRRKLTRDPMFVDRDMIDELRPQAMAYVESVASEASRTTSLDGMAFAALEALAAGALPGPSVHREVANQLLVALDTVLK
ncbi:MAG: DUF6473 family protein [bacterium]